MTRANKVLIYATCGQGLLTFTEPDFPDILPQVPGGSIEPNETPHKAALREFEEETGIVPLSPLIFVGQITYRFAPSGVTLIHRRDVFHLVLPDPQPANWDHWERSPSISTVPIRFRFSWMPLEQAKTNLGYAMGDLVHLLTTP